MFSSRGAFAQLGFENKMTAVGFEPTPLRTGAWSQRLRPLGQTVLVLEVGRVLKLRRRERRRRARSGERGRRCSTTSAICVQGVSVVDETR